MKSTAFILLVGFAFASCAKDRQCECKNANSTYIAGTVKGTKRQAKKHCESLSGTDTQCYLK